MRSVLGLLVATACTAVPSDPVALPATEGPPCLGAYVVEGGDTLAAIASRFAVAGGPSALAERNGIADPDRIEAGRGLIVPLEGCEVAAGLRPWDPPLPDLTEAAACEPRTTMLEGGCFAATGVCVEAVVDRELVTYLVRRGGRAEPWFVAAQPTFGKLEASLHRVDLDGDADDEVVVVHYVTTSNGIALTYWRVFVADEIGDPPASFHAHAVRFIVADVRGCDLVAEDFAAIDDPITGRGNYFVERRLGWSAGEVVPRGERLRARRIADTPPELRREPVLDGILVWSLPGTIVALQADDRGTVVVDHGLVKIEYGARPWRSDLATYVGLGRHGDALLLPAEYRPARETDWIGRRVHVEARIPYVGAIEMPTHVLRITPAAVQSPVSTDESSEGT
jgi:hypothetical protein